MTSVLNVDTIADKAGSGPVGLTKQFALKSWVNFDQDSAAIRQSFNTSGITDGGTGISVISYTNNFSYADYGIGGAFNRTGTDDFLNTYFAHTTALTKYQHYAAGSAADSDDIGAVVAGDLA